MPPLFLSHGSPMTALEPREAGAFMQRLGPLLSAKFGRPRAVIVISAHTLTREPALLAAARHEAVYDFGDFDQRLNQLLYNAAGAPALAAEVAQQLQAQGLPAHVLPQGGMDHGIWTPLRFLFPEADIPVLPLGWPPNWSPQQLLALGRALQPFTQQGVLVLGSGSITHNLRRVFAQGLHSAADQAAAPESLAFCSWFAQRGAAGDWDALAQYRAQAPHAELMHPTDEHLLPFYVAAGAAGAGGPAQGAAPAALRLHTSHTHGYLGMDAYAFGPDAQHLLETQADATWRA